MVREQVQVLVGDHHLVELVAGAARHNHFAAHFTPLDEAARRGLPHPADAYVITLDRSHEHQDAAFAELLLTIADSQRACLVLGDDRPVIPEHAGVFTWMSSRDPRALADALAGLIARSRDLRGDGRGTPTAEPVALRAGHWVEKSTAMLRAMEGFAPLRVEVLFAPSDIVSGDTFDVQRVDADHIGVVVADATGHGLSAAMLSVLVRNAVRGQRHRDGHDSVHAPDEVLTRLNEDLLSMDASEEHFAAVTYALVNTRTRLAAIARAGAPYPLLRTNGSGVELLKAPGAVLGIDEDAQFGITTVTLGPQDSLLLYSDGLDALLGPELAARGLQAPATRPRTVRPDEEIRATDWFDLFESEGPTHAMRDLCARHAHLQQREVELDDLTVLALSFPEDVRPQA
jgi:hypothetical protein